MDWLDLLAVQGTLKSLLQHHSSEASILLRSAFFIVQLSHPYMTTGKTRALTRQTFVDKVMSLLFNMQSRYSTGKYIQYPAISHNGKEYKKFLENKIKILKIKLQYSGLYFTSWQIDGESVETVADFIFLGSKITGDGDCSHEIKRRLLLGRTPVISLNSILKSRDITLPTKICLVKGMVFPVVMYGCDSWTIKKAERRRIDAFELRCWRRLCRVPWTARRSNQAILKEISPEYSLEGLKLKLQYFGHLMQRTDSLEKTLMLGKLEGRRRG